MKVLLWGTVIFFLALVFHLALWRVFVPKNGIKALLQVFLGMYLAATVLLYSASLVCAGVERIAPRGVLEYIHICLYCTALALSYIITYSAIEADSPSIDIIMTIAGAGARGLQEDELERALTDDLLVTPRIEDLLRDKMIVCDGGRYRITAKGSIFVWPFIAYRTLLGLKKGG